MRQTATRPDDRRQERRQAAHARDSRVESAAGVGRARRLRLPAGGRPPRLRRQTRDGRRRAGRDRAAHAARRLRVDGDRGAARRAGRAARSGSGASAAARCCSATFNAGIRTPPVALGVLLWLLLWPDSRWGGGLLSGLGWIYTLSAVILAQTLLALPIVVALTAAAVQRVPDGLLDQARAFGAPACAARAARAARGARRRAGGADRRARDGDRVGRRDPRRRQLARQRDARDRRADALERRRRERAARSPTGRCCSASSSCSPRS